MSTSVIVSTPFLSSKIDPAAAVRPAIWIAYLGDHRAGFDLPVTRRVVLRVLAKSLVDEDPASIMPEVFCDPLDWVCNTLRAAEIGAAEVSVLEVGAAEIGVLEVGAAEIGAAEVGAVEVGAAAVSLVT